LWAIFGCIRINDKQQQHQIMESHELDGAMASKDRELASAAVIDPAFCAEKIPTDLTLWVSHCACFYADSNYIRVSSSSSSSSSAAAATSSSSSAAADPDQENGRISDGKLSAAFTLDHEYIAGCRPRCDLILRDAIAGLELVRAHPQVPIIIIFSVF
jgi:hypothetical protein